jgi:hypothetical protein
LGQSSRVNPIAPTGARGFTQGFVFILNTYSKDFWERENSPVPKKKESQTLRLKKNFLRILLKN